MGLVGLVIGAVFAVALAGVTSVAARTFTVNIPDDAPDNNPGDGICNVNAVGTPYCSLRAAIEEANETTVSDTIKFNCSAIGNGGLVHVDSGITIEESVVIQGTSSKSCPTIDGNSADNGNGIFNVDDGVVKLRYLKVINGFDQNGGGGCLDNQDGNRVEVKKVIFDSCAAGRPGGAVDVDDDVLTVTGSTFTNNVSEDNGGAINADDGCDFFNLSKSTFKNNQAQGDGGAINTACQNNEITTSKFYGNDADDDGGAIKVDSFAVVTYSQFKYNNAGFGGAMCAENFGGLVQVNNSFSGNDGVDDPSGLQDNLCAP
jgi:CSLREA domain-containing protein